MNSYQDDFYLEKNMDFLNNGSFGACPKPVLEVQRDWQIRMENQLIRFFMRELPIVLRESAEVLGKFIGSKPDDIVFVENATTGANAVIRSVMPQLQKGDILLTSSHCYGAVLSTMQYACDCTGAQLVIADVPFPIESPQQVLDAMLPAIGDKVKLVVLDHITSSTGIVFPIEPIIKHCREKGIPILIDGAHAPGMVKLNMEELQPDWYTGNCHKWLFAPKGCAFLWTHPEKQKATHPTIISHGYGSNYITEFDFTGTKDYSPYLALPKAIEYYLNIGYERIYSHNHNLVVKMRDRLCEAWSVSAPAPISMLGYLATIPCPLSGNMMATMNNAAIIHDLLWDTYRVELPVMPFHSKLWWRISTQIFNSETDYDKLLEIGKNINLING